MGKCFYCAKEAGFLRRAHQQCRGDYAARMVSLRDAGRFKECAMAAEKLIHADPSIALGCASLLSIFYYAAMCNAKDPDVRDLRTAFLGMEEHIRSINPSLYKLLYEDPSQEQLEDEVLMRGCTLEALDCTYAQARAKAKLYLEEVLITGDRGGPAVQIAAECLTTIRMMDEMYGLEGDKPSYCAK